MFKKEIEKFLLPYCNGDKTANIGYKNYEYSSLIQSIPFRKMVEMIESDISEMRYFLSCYNIYEDEKVLNSTFSIYKKHLVIL